MEYYGLDAHELLITSTCMNKNERIRCRGRVATTPEAIREIVAPSGRQGWVALDASAGLRYVYDTLDTLAVQNAFEKERLVGRMGRSGWTGG